MNPAHSGNVAESSLITKCERTSSKHDYRSSDINETLNIIGQAAATDETFQAHLDSLSLLAKSILNQNKAGRGNKVY